MVNSQRIYCYHYTPKMFYCQVSSRRILGIDKYSFLCYNVDMSTFGNNTPYFLYVYGESDDFGGGGRFSYRCPQAMAEVDCGRYTKRYCSVVTRDFPTDRLAKKLLPNFRTSVEDAFTWMSVYYGLQRFQDKVGLEPITVRICDEEVSTALVDGEMPTRCQDWYKAIFNIKWMGVQFEWANEETVKRVIYG